MKRAFLLLLLCFGFSSAHANTIGQFAVYYGIIRVVPTSPSGGHDNDSVNLFNAMNVPVKDSMLGPGKVVQTKDSALQFICANRTGSGFECSIFIQPGANSSVNPMAGTMDYKLSGSEADIYGKEFFLDGSGSYEFTSVEHNLSVTIHPGQFEVSFHQN